MCTAIESHLLQLSCIIALDISDNFDSLLPKEYHLRQLGLETVQEIITLPCENLLSNVSSFSLEPFSKSATDVYLLKINTENICMNTQLGLPQSSVTFYRINSMG